MIRSGLRLAGRQVALEGSAGTLSWPISGKRLSLARFAGVSRQFRRPTIWGIVDRRAMTEIARSRHRLDAPPAGDLASSVPATNRLAAGSFTHLLQKEITDASRSA